MITLKDYTFVRKLYKNILRMISEIFLTESQISELRFALRGHKAMEVLVKRCDEKNISSRATTYKALDPDQYNGDSVLHRTITNEAVNLLKDTYQVTFPWAEIETAAA